MYAKINMYARSRVKSLYTVVYSDLAQLLHIGPFTILMQLVTFVTSDNNTNDFISGKIHVDSAVPAWFFVSPVARSPAKLGVTH